MSEMELIESLGRRFAGFDLQCRNGGTDWPQRWRASMIANKNERSEYRMAAYGATAAEACQSLLETIQSIEGGARP